jgi:hypothetical protein
MFIRDALIIEVDEFTIFNMAYKIDKLNVRPRT